jgi:hypothetical protein
LQQYGAENGDFRGYFWRTLFNWFKRWIIKE